MGTFAGHALPGTFLMAFGIWMTFKALYGYYRKIHFENSNRNQYLGKSQHSKSIPLTQCLEGALKLIFTTIGFIGEIVTGLNGGKFEYIGNGQHATMFFFFGLSGLVDILLYFKCPLPPFFDSAVLLAAFIVEALLFNFHLHGRSELDVVIHTLLLYVVYATIACLLAKMASGTSKQSALIKLAFSFCVLLQGTWFWQVGFILYNPFPGATKWTPDDHREIVLVTMMFAWHMAAILVSMAIAAILISHKVRYKMGNKNNSAELKPLNGSAEEIGDETCSNDV